MRSETGDEAAGSAFFADLLRRAGWEPESTRPPRGAPTSPPASPGTGPPVAGGPSCPSLVMNGHVDTIPIGRSWPPRRDGDWIYGRGTEDMKGGLVAMVHAAQAVERVLGRAGTALRGDLWLTAVVGHETPVGRKEGPLRLIERMRAGAIPASAILICEGPAAIWRASLGSAIFHLTLEAQRPPIHTIKVPYRENPVRALAPSVGRARRWTRASGPAPATIWPARNSSTSASSRPATIPTVCRCICG